jgi:hypothetical protein
MTDEPSIEPDTTHVGVAEQGKVHALDGDHELALLYYRHAMRAAVAVGAPEVFFRHYLECSIESLELLGAFDEVLAYCDRLDEHYATFAPVDEAQRRFVAVDLATNAQRRGVVLAKAGEAAAAAESLATALDLARAEGLDLPLAELVAGWLLRGLHVDAPRLTTEQRRLCYFAVVDEAVDRSRAIRLPSSVLGSGG